MSEEVFMYLIFTLLPMDFQKDVVKTNLEMFYDPTDQYEKETPGLKLSEARVLNIIGGPKVCERSKMFKINWSLNWFLAFP